MLTVAGVVEAAGAALLKIVVPADDAEVRDVTIAELDDATTGRSGDLVLGAGVATPEQARTVVARCDEAGAAGLVLKPPLASHPDVTSAAAERRLTLVELQRHGSWAQLVWLLRGMIDRAVAPGSPETGEPGVYDELFALADATAAVVDAPVTIEDAQSRVLAYSSRQDRADPARVSTIVGRRAPGDVVAHFRSRGVFRRLATGSGLIFVPQGPDGTLPRLVVPIRAGGELLGSIWAVVEGPVPDARLRDLQGTASVLALHLLRLRVQADVARRVSADRLRAVLRAPGRTGREELALPEGPWRVVALGGTGEMVDNLALWESITRRHGWRQPLLADVGDVLFAVLVDKGGAPGSRRWMEKLVHDVAVHDPGLHAASGGVARDLTDLPRSRAEAAELLALRDPAGQRGPVLRFEDQWAEVVVHRVVGTVPSADLLVGGPLPDLVAHDREHGTDYVATVGAWLDQQGDLKRAARQLHVHPNTLRYRMRRLTEVVAVDLGSPRARLALQIQLAALGHAPTPRPVA
ncbi:helix-turn-helix domain-containing protein [Micromonospora sp. NPDC047074]|uniref:helix-turn-helix domain-containing protein n=1 Tax=Micromonospora sp. NPDC047074 TaxID=3154339 RepID=UPI0033C2CEF0